MDRRASIKTLLTGATVSLFGREIMAMDSLSNSLHYRPGLKPIYLFTKVLQWVPMEDLATTVQDLGFTGIDLAVRENGYITVPEIKAKLPKIVSKSQALKMDPLILTTTQSVEDPKEMEEFLKIISGEGVYDYRMGWLPYRSPNVVEDLKAYNQELKKAAELHEKYGVTGHYQNHAGNRIGGSVWEILYLLKGIDPKHIGIQFDLRHATVEGYKSYENAFKAIKGQITSFDLKDFVWGNPGGNGDEPVNVPLGKGNVDFKLLLEFPEFTTPEVPKIIHVEYDLGGAEHGHKSPSKSPSEILSAIREDVVYYNRNFIT